MKLYPVADHLSPSECRALGLTRTGFGWDTSMVRAVATGVTRPPRAGEWFLSGAVVEAWRAPNDLSTPYQLATLVLVREVKTCIIEKSL